MRSCPWVLVGLAVILASQAAGSPGEESDRPTHWVQLPKIAGHENPTIISKVVFELPFGHPVRHLEDEGYWWRVQPAGNHPKGWVHRDLFSTNPVVLDDVDEKTRRRVREGLESLAGRAFRPKVERAYRDGKKPLRHEDGYRWLDERLNDEVFHPGLRDDLVEFADEGGLTPLTGGEK